jgi:hypothetical protein
MSQTSPETELANFIHARTTPGLVINGKELDLIEAALRGHAQSPQQSALAEFFKWAMREGPWEGGDLEGGGIQDKAESLGLIVKTQFDPAKHGTAYGDFSEGDDYYEFAPGLADTSTVGNSKP